VSKAWLGGGVALAAAVRGVRLPAAAFAVVVAYAVGVSADDSGHE
jgi:hypothetical protein